MKFKAFMKHNLYSLAVCALAFGGVFCGKSIPVQEMSEARLQLEAAEQEEAPKHSPEKYEQARNALLAAHTSLGDEDYDDARVSAVQATDLAIAARETAAPLMVAERREQATQSLAAADEAYAEVLAAQDFAAAKSLYGEGETARGEAESGEAGNLEQRMAVLTDYNTAGQKFTDSASAAERAKNVALAQKGDMLDSLDGIRSNLQKAEAWGASDDELNELAAARATLAQAEKEINAGELKKASGTMQEAEAAAKALLAKVAAGYAQKKLEEANGAVAKAEKDFSEVNTDQNRKDDETRDILDTIDAQLAAAKEARGSAASYLEDNKPQASISESEDAIRLSQIIFEQYNLLATAQTRDASEIGEGGPDTSGGEVDETTTPEGWREYTVQRKSPADCLWCIAKRQEIYGNGRLWNRIYQANKAKIKNPNVIFPGQRLWIPPKSGSLTRPQPAVKDEETITVEPSDEDARKEDSDESTLMEKVEEKIDEALENAESEESEETMLEDTEDTGEEQPAESVE